MTLSSVISKNCPCERTPRRIQRIKGRNNYLLIINGVNIFPLQIKKALMQIAGTENNYLIEVYKQDYMDKLVIKVEVQQAFF